MSLTNTSFTLVDTPRQLQTFAEATKDASWIAFDTEFVGEKRYHTLLCLIQVTCEAGIFLLDPLRLDNLQPFLDLLVHPDICKITHAGDNDYRLLNSQYGIIPKNTFDTQLAAGFVGYRYPISFAKLAEGELNLSLKKGFAVTDWESRPFKDKQLAYALEDVMPLYPLYRSLSAKLEEKGRLSWLREECAMQEQADYYERDPHHEAINSNQIRSLRKAEQVFMIRLLAWRRQEAERKNYSKEMILPSKLISQIVRSVRSGKDALQQNRRIPAKTAQRFGDLFVEMYKAPATTEEQALLKQIPRDENEDEQDEMILELLYLLMKYKAQEEGIAHPLVMPRNAIKRMGNNGQELHDILGQGWRRELLGDNFVHWLDNYHDLRVRINGGRIDLVVER